MTCSITCSPWALINTGDAKTINWLQPFAPKQIMDVATGTGDFAILAYRMLQPDKVIGTDISEGMMNVGRDKVEKYNLSDKIHFIRED